MIFKLRREIVLPHDSAFYTTPRPFRVRLDTDACGELEHNGDRFSLKPSLDMQKFMATWPDEHEVSVKEAAEFAVRFDRAKGLPTWSVAQHRDAITMALKRFGDTYTVGKADSLAPRARRHTEAFRKANELLAYGVALHFVATVLRIPPERFFLRGDNGEARPDFMARVRSEELRGAGLHLGAISHRGMVINIEVKSLFSHASFRAKSVAGRQLLHQIWKKSEHLGKGQPMLAIAVALKEAKSVSAPFIIIADPGDVERMPDEDLLPTLLSELVVLFNRFGVYGGAGGALRWLEHIGELKTPSAREAELMEERKGTDQPLPVEEISGRDFRGRIFSDLLAGLGQTGDRPVSESEVRSRLDADELGEIFFSGVDDELLEIVHAKNKSALLEFGLGTTPQGHPLAEQQGSTRSVSLRDQSGIPRRWFAQKPLPAADYRQSIRAEVRAQLNRW